MEFDAFKEKDRYTLAAYSEEGGGRTSVMFSFASASEFRKLAERILEVLEKK